MSIPLIDPIDELTFDTFEACAKVADELLTQGYVIMISMENDIYILNAIWSDGYADRNSVVFMDRDRFYMNFQETSQEDEEDD